MTTQHIVRVGNNQCGSKTLFLISGHCVFEAEEIMMKTADFLKIFSEKFRIPLIEFHEPEVKFRNN